MLLPSYNYLSYLTLCVFYYPHTFPFLLFLLLIKMAQNWNQALIKVAQHQDQVMIKVELDQDQVLTRVGLDQDWVSGRCK